MTENRHIPVLLSEVLEAFLPLNTKARAVILDCTLGGAGHTFALLQKYDKINILACDTDPKAIEEAKSHRLSTFFNIDTESERDRVRFFHGNFSELVEIPSNELPTGFGPKWDGVLMDLGYSSNQLEDDEIGMSFMNDAALDMRLSRKGQTAWELLQDSSEKDLADLFYAYGEMRGGGKIAFKIKQAIADGEVINSTKSLAGFLERITPAKLRGDIHPATLVFQSLRIAVNDELRVLDHFLKEIIDRLQPSARVAIITFHSLEDRIVKRWGQDNKDTLEAITKKPIVAGSEEVKANPRARSAKLRIYEVRTK